MLPNDLDEDQIRSKVQEELVAINDMYERLKLGNAEARLPTSSGNHETRADKLFTEMQRIAFADRIN
jgi:hypothetical protein